MQIFNNYIEKHVTFHPFIDEKPHNELKNIIVIPCYNEPDILQTLKSVKRCKTPDSPVEVVVVINSAENSVQEIIKQNHSTKQEIEQWAVKENTDFLKFHTIYIDNIPRKIAGAGFARKAGMDEAVRRFAEINNSVGIIASLDADSLVAENYLIEIEKLFVQNPKADACSIYFEHPISGNEFSQLVYDKITEYELYMRYYTLSLKFTGFPYYYHTVGSAFAVKAQTYCKQGGMNKKQAGEDFYFLHKIMPLGNYHYLKSTTVYPSPRPSNRVPFGTGPVIRSAVERPEKEFKAYHFEVFLNLRDFFTLIDQFFKIKDFNYSGFDFHPSIKNFLEKNNFIKALDEINANTSNRITFRKRFFRWFDAFRIIKYINFAHEHYYKKLPVSIAAAEYLKNTNNVRLYTKNMKQLLLNFRETERSTC